MVNHAHHVLVLRDLEVLLGGLGVLEPGRGDDGKVDVLEVDDEDQSVKLKTSSENQIKIVDEARDEDKPNCVMN